jgi:hypothetical protein
MRPVVQKVFRIVSRFDADIDILWAYTAAAMVAFQECYKFTFCVQGSASSYTGNFLIYLTA